MSDGNDTKTKEQLLAEIAALKEQFAQRDGVTGSATAQRATLAEGQASAGEVLEGKAPASAPVFAAPMTRRQSMVSWVAPVILSMPVIQAVGAVIKPGTAYASDDVPAPVPTAKPTTIPKPTAKPIPKPTVASTAAPTATPTAAPTRAGQCIVPPTAPPTVAPTIGMASTPDSRPIAGGFVPLGDARALVRGDIGP